MVDRWKGDVDARSKDGAAGGALGKINKGKFQAMRATSLRQLLRGGGGGREGRVRSQAQEKKESFSLLPQ